MRWVKSINNRGCSSRIIKFTNIIQVIYKGSRSHGKTTAHTIIIKRTKWFARDGIISQIIFVYISSIVVVYLIIVLTHIHKWIAWTNRYIARIKCPTRVCWGIRIIYSMIDCVSVSIPWIEFWICVIHIIHWKFNSTYFKFSSIIPCFINCVIWFCNKFIWTTCRSISCYVHYVDVISRTLYLSWWWYVFI